MSAEGRAFDEAAEMLWHMGIPRIDAKFDADIRKFFVGAAASVLEFGAGTVHDPADHQDLSTVDTNRLLEAHEQLGLLLPGQFMITPDALTTDPKPEIE